MTKGNITLIGLGPGDPELLTRRGWRFINSCREIYLRTNQHPVVKYLPAQIELHSFDDLYDKTKNFETVYSKIVDCIIGLANRSQGVVYAVPGHPFVAEATCSTIIERAQESGIKVVVIDGLSFLEPTFTALKHDPIPNTILIDAMDLSIAHVPNFSPSNPAIIVQIYSASIASDVKLTLMEIYPDIHEVYLIHSAGTNNELVEHLSLFEIDRNKNLGSLSSLYVPPLNQDSSFESFHEVIAHLRAPDGCPWDREQTHSSLRPFMLEEAYEVLEALDTQDPQKMKEEFGDLLLQIVLHAQIAAENGEFTIAEVIQGIHKKIVDRHPHVFAGMDLLDHNEVLLNWERVKAEERENNGMVDKNLLDGVAKSLPSLIRADQFLHRTSRVGFSWPGKNETIEEIESKIHFIGEITDKDKQAAAFGEILFAVVRLAQIFHVDAESALREKNNLFNKRIDFVEKLVQEKERKLSDLSEEDLRLLWFESERS